MAAARGSIYTCFFGFACKDLGMQTAYHEEKDTFNFCRLLMALPFLPAEYITRTFQELQVQEVGPPLGELMTYLETQWIMNSEFPIESWSVFKRPFRTNDDVEGWHNRLNQNVPSGGLNLYELIKRLHEEATDVDLTCQLVEEMQMIPELQREKYTMLHEKIVTLWEQFEDRDLTIKSLLKSCSHLNGP